jgi:hypothetical protein
MFSSLSNVGAVEVLTTSNRGWTPEEWADRFVDRLISVSENAPPPIRDQAFAFKDAAYQLAVHHMKQVVRSDRTTLINKLREAGQHDAADLIQRI